jgi:hypothetical protein
VLNCSASRGKRIKNPTRSSMIYRDKYYFRTTAPLDRLISKAPERVVQKIKHLRFRILQHVDGMRLPYFAYSVLTNAALFSEVETIEITPVFSPRLRRNYEGQMILFRRMLRALPQIEELVCAEATWRSEDPFVSAPNGFRLLAPGHRFHSDDRHKNVHHGLVSFQGGQILTCFRKS